MFLKHKCLTTILLTFYIFTWSIKAENTCIIESYDDVEASVAECTDIVIKDLIVPGGKTLNLNLQNSTRVLIDGIVTFEHFSWAGPLVKITGNNVKIFGKQESLFDGLGHEYWDGKGSSGTLKPKFVTLEVTNNSYLTNINLLNCPVQCVTIKNSDGVLLNGWTVDCSSGDAGVAPPGNEGHNTDGFDVIDSHDVTIQNTIVYNQDDCVSVSRGTNLLFHTLYCSGSHGLSLSASFSEDGANNIENVTYYTCIVVNSKNAIHVKTHTNSAAGIVRNITYKNIQFSGITEYAINIEQDYENGGPTGTANNNINITELNLDNVRGSIKTSAVPVYIFCGDSSCSNWTWSKVKIKGSPIISNADECNFEPDGYECK